MSATYRKDRILLSDGRRGTQERYRRDDGSWELSCVTITNLADGSPRRQVYAQRSFYADGIRHLTDLGNVTWEIEHAQEAS